MEKARGSRSGRRTAKQTSLQGTTHKRLQLTIIIVIAIAALLVLRLFYLQVLQADILSATASQFRTRSYTQEAKRGDILDATGAVLATSVPRYNVRVDQVAIQDYREYDDDDKLVGAGPAYAARVLAPVLNMDQSELGGILNGGSQKSQWVMVKKGVTPEQWREIDALDVHGIFPERYMQRIYPNGQIAGDILGFVGQTEEDSTSSGRSGIEQAFNETLQGVDGALRVEVGPDGTVFPQASKYEQTAQDGRSVKLTIDRDLQETTQRALADHGKKFGAVWAAAAVVEIGTGRVLALADLDAPDPNKLEKVDPKAWRVDAIGAPTEPGSVGKLLTFAAAIDQGSVSPTDTFVVETPHTTPNGETFTDSESHPRETETVAGILAHSYNTGTVQIGDTLSDEVRYKYMQKFGIGEKTGIELLAEEPGTLRPPDTWDKRTHYTTMFGQAWAGTTLQMAQVGAVLGNKGVMIPLHIVEGTWDANGQYLPAVQGKARQVISAESATTMLQMMQAVTQKGSTAPNAKVPGYNVAGKTGTAQIIKPEGGMDFVGSFVGVMPADNPKIAVSIMLYKTGSVAYGGTVSAPIFAEIGEFAMRQMKVPPSSEPLYRYPWVPGEDVSADGNGE
ncbi:MAG: penicillin-binding protein 2 [Actinomycetaceae bacterium]|nr:penicillin-binding protein 2 [Arcanobacterium sp.]MDD7505418.1 penicillin-binding protein 2 [Actinomycetaceae bacterium]MDY6142773.1 penicillin-binding protein 2 [Arcanobacterium sp.]